MQGYVCFVHLQIYSDDEGETNPPSRPGFESEAEQSTHMFNIPFSPVSCPDAPFPATLLQDHLQLDSERFTAAVLPSGLSPRVNNIVRAFTIHGPLDRQLLSRALDSVASLHPVLTAHFQRTSDRLYMQTPPPGELASQCASGCDFPLDCECVRWLCVHLYSLSLLHL